MSWIPIRSLGARHRRAIVDHLCALDSRSRHLRFGHVATDEQMSAYVEQIDFDRDEVFGVFNRRLDLIAVAHLAHRVGEPAPAPGTPAMSEFGVSVLQHVRRRGFGRRLFEHAMLHARNRRIDKLFIHALSENVAMLKIARQAGAKVERDGAESQAWLRLPPGSLASHLNEIIGEQAAEFDFCLKVHAHQIQSLASEPRAEAPSHDDSWARMSG